ncbi:MAG: bifunctional metallophosphatase/5'-nucleotidase [Eubacteriales bacterium]
MNNDNGEELYGFVQGYVDECRKSGADYVVILSHLGDVEASSPFSSTDLISNTTGIDVVLDAHSHSYIPCRIEQNKDGNDVFLSSTGEKLENIGQLVITEKGYISTGLVNYTQKDADTVDYIESVKAKYESSLKNIVATSDIKLTGYDENGNRLVRNRETTIGNFCADAYRTVTGADIAFINGGGIRADLPAGEITYADMLSVHPFGNMICVAEVTGQQIIDCLEMASRFTQPVTSDNGIWIGENGGFQQVSGLKYTIDTSVESSIVLDSNGGFVSVSGERRVKSVMVLKDGVYTDISPDATYTLASHAFLIKQGGDGLNMFVGNKLIMDEGLLDYQILVTYIMDHLNGKLGEKYSSIEGRITVK